MDLMESILTEKISFNTRLLRDNNTLLLNIYEQINENNQLYAQLYIELYDQSNFMDQLYKLSQIEQINITNQSYKRLFDHIKNQNDILTEENIKFIECINKIRNIQEQQNFYDMDIESILDE